jgi:hypothetical protein
MKKKEVEKFVDEVGLPLYEELTKIDKETNKWIDTHPAVLTEFIRTKPFLPLSKNEFYDTRENMKRDKLLKKKKQ